MTTVNISHWNREKSRTLYNIQHWSAGYFDINSAGHVQVFPRGRVDKGIDLQQLALTLQAADLAFPVLVRFSNILQHRVSDLTLAFQNAMQQQDYAAHYTAIYPIKVNQQRPVVEAILACDDADVGLEAGSKPELLAVLALSHSHGIIICNGYKDREYIRLALIGQGLGLRPYLVIEKSAELQLIMQESQALGITPLLGIRVRLASIAVGKWQNTGGEKAKFGLSSAQVLAVIKTLKTANLLNCLSLMHFHIGSQVANIDDIQTALQEAAQYYVQLHRLQVPIQHIDVGGGLGVDYDGTHSRNACSINYDFLSYAIQIVQAFARVCRAHHLPQANLLSESGRAITAHHAILITQVIDVEKKPNTDKKNQTSVTYEDANTRFNHQQQQFSQGILTLEQRAQAEQEYLDACFKLQQQQTDQDTLDALNEKLAAKYFCNFSLFQSAPDAWAIQQIFPIMPLQRLNEKPSQAAILQDLTCDSDGQFNQYVSANGICHSLALHPIAKDETYLLGIFLVGAYQEILGDMHNLFGDTHAVNVVHQADGSYQFNDPEYGDSVADMLRYVHFDMDNLRSRYRHALAKTLHQGDINETQRQQYLAELLAGLAAYTYLT